MVAMTPYDELGKVLKLKRKGDESFEAFTARTTKKINTLSDAQWNELTEELQLWHNKTAEAREKGGDDIDESRLPVLEGWPGNDPEEAGDEPDAADGEGDDDSQAAGDEVTAADDEAAEGVESPEQQDVVDPEADSAQKEPGAAAKSKSKSKRSARKPTETAAKPAAAPGKAKASPVEKPSKPVQTKEKEMTARNTPAKSAAKAAKKAATASARTRLGEADTIKLIAKANPYRDGSLGAKVFAKYRDGLTVKQFVAGVAKLDTNRPPLALLRFDIAKGYVKVQSAA
jgi:hypothetical protein